MFPGVFGGNTSFEVHDWGIFSGDIFGNPIPWACSFAKIQKLKYLRTYNASVTTTVLI